MWRAFQSPCKVGNETFKPAVRGLYLDSLNLQVKYLWHLSSFLLLDRVFCFLFGSLSNETLLQTNLSTWHHPPYCWSYKPTHKELPFECAKKIRSWYSFIFFGTYVDMSSDQIPVLKPSALAIYKQQLNLVRLKGCLDWVPNCHRPLLSGTFSLLRNSKSTHSEHPSSLFIWWRLLQVPATQHFIVVMHRRIGNITQWSSEQHHFVKVKLPYFFFLLFTWSWPPARWSWVSLWGRRTSSGSWASRGREGSCLVWAAWFPAPVGWSRLCSRARKTAAARNSLSPTCTQLSKKHRQRRGVEDECKSVHVAFVEVEG